MDLKINMLFYNIIEISLEQLQQYITTI